MTVNKPYYLFSFPFIAQNSKTRLRAVQRAREAFPAAGQARVIVLINSPAGQQAAPICRARIVYINSRSIRPTPVLSCCKIDGFSLFVRASLLFLRGILWHFSEFTRSSCDSDRLFFMCAFLCILCNSPPLRPPARRVIKLPAAPDALYTRSHGFSRLPHGFRTR